MTYTAGGREARSFNGLIGAVVAVFLLIVIGRGLVAWGQHPHGTVNTQRLEQQIHDWAVQKEGAAPTVTVQCPSDVTITAGRTFDCTIVGTNRSVSVNVTIRDDRGSIQWQAMMTPGQPIT